MGGDGGVIASNRRYMRGAGTADHTADGARAVVEASTPEEVMATCYLTKQPLHFREAIVCDPYGRLYQKEAAVEALLRRKAASNQHDELGDHIRGLKDLVTVHFHLSDDKPTPICPVTSQPLNGKLPCLLLVSADKKNSDNKVNVVSEKALKQLGEEALQSEYGPFKEKLRLAPTAVELELIQLDLETKRQNKKKNKKEKTKDKKRKERDEDETENGKHDKHYKQPSNGKHSNGHKHKQLKTASTAAVEMAQQRVQTAVASNDVLSSLFTKQKSNKSVKERNNNLFAHNFA